METVEINCATSILSVECLLQTVELKYPAKHPALIILFFVIQFAVSHGFPLNLLKNLNCPIKIEPHSQWKKFPTSFNDGTNRVSEILESTTIDEWFHVPTGNIPADTVTRGITAEALKETDGLKGPFFLKTKV